ncbi:hypothetical protein FAF44_27680 [Nonomuraea sp. MG754425]|uniref:DUF5988 family protein n=1 Tax=Nonomuraea sp. MG754425 TaxID=2570319 RepID=UPI001F31BB96|nr:DUF5988 family protein [Nonomuraea sp. MG754425]MCF6472144.1 hypothetical protein [Nonomuraea sp. MG754425]
MGQNLSSLVHILLTGGPDALEAADRRRRIPAGESEVKVRRAHCTEHFRRTPVTVRIHQREFQVYDWSHRTYVAE